MAVDHTSMVRLHPLVFKQEDAGNWIVGRIDSGEFVEVPAEGATFLRALDSTESIAGACERVRALHGKDVDAADFVETLIELGFVASLDGHPVGPMPKPASLCWLRPAHVRWAFSLAVQVCVCAFVVAGVVVALRRGDLVPSYAVFFITDSQSVNLIWNTVMWLVATAIHEFWHLAAARADGVHARLGLGTRLQFLVAQTTVTGLWGVGRRIRLRVYLAGIASDLMIWAACSLAISLAAPEGFFYRSLKAGMLILLVSIAAQFMLFMRTDMYFVLQELLGCKNLYGDAWDYARYITAKVLRRQPLNDPMSQVAPHEKVAIKLYMHFMTLGSFITVCLFLFYGLPIVVTLFFRAFLDLVHGLRSRDLVQTADGLTVLAVEGSLQITFLFLFLTKHGAKLRRIFNLVRGRAQRQDRRASA